MALLEFKRTIDIGNLLTLTTIVLSALALLYTMHKDQGLRVRDQANDIRISASNVIERVDQLAVLPLLSVSRLQKSFVETSELMVQGGEWAPLTARDFLWKAISEEKERLDETIFDRNLNILTGHFFAYDPKIREKYRSVVRNLQDLRNEFFGKLLQLTQFDILEFMETKEDYQTATLGNRLRYSAEQAKIDYLEKANAAIEDLIAELTGTVELNDTQLIIRLQP